MARKKSAIGLPADMTADTAYIQGMADGLEETIQHSSEPLTFDTFKKITIPIGAVRMELTALQKNGIEHMPLSDFLMLVHKVVKENPYENESTS